MLDIHLFRLRLKHKNEYVLVPYISESLYHYLYQIKNEITKYNKKWDKFKKFTNVYEYISTLIPEKKYSVCALKPISRSFYKLIEIVNHFHLFKAFESRNMTSFHLAEGPGGFIEAMKYMRPMMNDTIYGMTLHSSNDNIPSWKIIMNSSANLFHMVEGHDKTGDITKSCNFRYCADTYRNQIDFITGDGGFDFTIDFNKQEIMAIPLILSEIFMALAMQSVGGCFVLKIYDIFTKITIELLYLLYHYYDVVYIYKPCMSRTANSEKYIICKNYNKVITDDMITLFENILKKIEASPDYMIESILDVELDMMYLNKIQEINVSLGEQQLENISITIHLILNSKNDKITNLIKNNIESCVDWCGKYKLPIHENIEYPRVNI